MSAETVLRKLQQTKQRMRDAVMHAASTYAFGHGVKGNATGRSVAIVNRHFTLGNQQRYGWAPLSRDYFLDKQGSLGKAKVFFNPGGGKQKIKLDPKAEFTSSTGELVGIGSGKNKPMLVNSGALKAAMAAGKHSLRQTSDGSVIVVFRGLPAYAIYLHEGDGMPKRSPVSPSAEDIAEVQAAAARFMDASLGTGKKSAGPVGFGGAPARMV